MTQLTPMRLKTAAAARQHLVINPPADSEIEELKQPAYLAHIAHRLKIGDIIEVVPDDMRWWAQVIVTNKSQNAATVDVLFHTPLDAAEADEVDLPGYELRFVGGKMRWCVVRLEDREYVFQEGSRSEAIKWMEDRASQTPAPKPQAAPTEQQQEDAGHQKRRRKAA